MKCDQCERPSFYLVGPQKIPLCIDCAHKAEQIANDDFIKNAVMMNHALDQMDIVSGIYTPGGRLPVKELATAMRKPLTFNNISVSNSQVGVINTGELAKIDAAITMSSGSDADEVGQALRALTEGVISSHEIAAETKKEIIELMNVLSEQVIKERKPSVISSLLKSIEERAKGGNAIIQLVTTLKATISNLLING